MRRYPLAILMTWLAASLIGASFSEPLAGKPALASRYHLSVSASAQVDDDDQTSGQDEPTRKPIRRAARPTFTEREITTIFFLDIFSDGLSGSRPNDMGRLIASNGTGNSGGNGDATGGTGTTPESSAYAWSNVISAEAIEQEVKRLNTVIQQVVTTPGKFESGGYRDARLHFTMLAMLFAIINEYDDPDVKWRSNSVAARTLFASMASNAKVGSQAVYRQARLRKDDLLEIVNGGKISASGDIEEANDWEQIVDRPPLMIRLDIAYEDRLKPWTSSEAEFRSNKDELLVEAAIVAAIGEVLTREGLPDAIEDGYVDYSVEMRMAASQIIEAIAADNYDLAADSVSLIGQSCQNCHGDWQ